MSKPRVLILGGCGFIGRHLVRYLLANDLCEKIRIVDKTMPAMLRLPDDEKAFFDNPVVEFKQVKLGNPQNIAKAFDDDQDFQYVFNLAAETKGSQGDEVYEQLVFQLSVKCAEEAAKRKIERYIEVSDAHVYEPKQKASAEDAKLKPWTAVAKYHLEAEKALLSMDLPVVIVRPSVVYGPGDVQGIMPRLICGAVYRYLGEKMKFLWSGDLALNTVHVSDVARALWHLTKNGQVKEVYNLADKSATTQDSLNKFIGPIFDIKTGFQGTMVSNLARTAGMKNLSAMVNDKHMEPWSDLCKEAGILDTQLSPYLDLELLYNNSLSVDGKKIESTGFSYEVPEVTQQTIADTMDYQVALKLMPAVSEIKAEGGKGKYE